MLATLELPFYSGVFTFIVVWTLFELWVEFRQWRCYFRTTLPAVLKGSLDVETLEKANAYNKDKASFGLLHSLWDLGLTLATLHFGFLPFMWEHARSWGFESEIVTSLLFALEIMVLSTPIGWPWNLYKAFVIEERHGFNKMTLATWVKDQVKMFGLSAAIGAFVLSAIIWITRWAGDYFYLWAYFFFVAFQLILFLVYFDYIAPCFNVFKQLDPGELLSGIEALTSKLNFPLKKVFVIDGSARSAHSNAFFFGIGSNKRIVLYDTLLEKCNTQQILSVLAHELGHWSHSHTIFLMLLQLVLFFFFFLLWGALSLNVSLYAQFGFHSERPVIIGLILFSMIIGPLDSVIDLGLHYLSRKFEYQADEFAARLGYDLSESLIALNSSNLGAVHVDPLYSFIHNSHPTLLERLDAMEQFKKRRRKKQ